MAILVPQKRIDRTSARAKRFAKLVLRSPRVAGDFLYDFRRWLSHSAYLEVGDHQIQLKAAITRYTHGIEKGLSLPAPRPHFGRSHIQQIRTLTERYRNQYGDDDTTAMVYAVLRQYIEFNAAHPSPDGFLTEVQSFIPANADGTRRLGGVVNAPAPITDADEQARLTTFIRSRASVRNFRPEIVPEHVLTEAIACAMRAPAVCNRQFACVWHTSDPDKIENILSLQGGAKGFINGTPTLLAVTVDLSAYVGDERYQGWIDGGLFAMNLILGLQAQGVATCCLNWSKNRQDDKAMRGRVGISDSENIIMFLAAGYSSEGAKVALSKRQNPEHFLRSI